MITNAFFEEVLFTQFHYLWIISEESNRKTELDTEAKGQSEENEMDEAMADDSNADKKTTYKDGETIDKSKL